MALFLEPTDVSVRPAAVGDAHSIATVQIDAWRLHHSDILPTETLANLDRDAMTAHWERTIAGPSAPGYRVLVACQGPAVIGFTAVGPVHAGPDRASTEATGEIFSLEVAPASQRSGHGSRLLAAAVATAREDGCTVIVTWVLDDSPGRARFLTSAGLAADGGVRVLSPEPHDGGLRVQLTERRWSATI